MKTLTNIDKALTKKVQALPNNQRAVVEAGMIMVVAPLYVVGMGLYALTFKQLAGGN